MPAVLLSSCMPLDFLSPISCGAETGLPPSLGSLLLVQLKIGLTSLRGLSMSIPTQEETVSGKACKRILFALCPHVQNF